MAKIHVLEKHVVELIAAGEVVERPSSVIKELVENSIDAGATTISVEIQRGGIAYMRVTDNGGGIAREDVPKAFLRNATSKVESAEDLDGIGTLGFRGEALASICAVSRVTLLTRTEEELAGTSYQIEGGEELALEDAGCAKGCTIVVRDLFYNTPARMKFLKKDVSEANAVAGVMDRAALSHPEISFRFVRDHKETLSTPGDRQLRSCIYAVYGKDFTAGLIPVDYAYNGIKVRGFISKPSAVRPNRSMQHFFINGRFVKSKTAMVALEQAFKGSIMAGKFPSCVLHLSVPWEAVDVNVHPSKIEVRFLNEKPIFDAVYHGVKSALLSGDQRKEMILPRPKLDPPASQPEQIRLAAKPAIGPAAQVTAEKEARLLTSQTEQAPNSSLGAYEKVVSGSAGRLAQSQQAPLGKAPDKAFPQTASGPAVAGTSHIGENAADKKPPSSLPGIGAAGRIPVPYEENEPEIYLPVKRQTAIPAVRDFISSPFSFSDEASKPKAAGEAPGDTGFEAAAADRGRKAEPKAQELSEEAAGEKPESSRQAAAAEPPREEAGLQPFGEKRQRLVGEAFRTYLIIEYGDDELLLIDKHAAHERILYEKLKKESGKSCAQYLLEPIPVTLDKNEYAAVLENQKLFWEAGFEVEDFGGGSVLVRSAPLSLEQEDIASSLMEIAGHLLENKTDMSTEKLDWLYHNIACRAAVKAGQITSDQELIALAVALRENPEIRYCPHGRPVSITLKKREIEKQFGRIQ